MPDEGGATKMKVPQEPTTKEPQISINRSNIKVPVDIQDALEIKEELYAADGTGAQQITMDKRGYDKVQVTAHSSNAANLHIYTVDYSYDNVTWYNAYTSAGAERTIEHTYPDVSARYWRLGSDAVAGVHTVDLVLASTP